MSELMENNPYQPYDDLMNTLNDNKNGPMTTWEHIGSKNIANDKDETIPECINPQNTYSQLTPFMEYLQIQSLQSTSKITSKSEPHFQGNPKHPSKNNMGALFHSWGLQRMVPSFPLKRETSPPFFDVPEEPTVLGCLDWFITILILAAVVLPIVTEWGSLSFPILKTKTLPETNSSARKLMVGRWNAFWETLFSGAFAVRFREQTTRGELVNGSLVQEFFLLLFLQVGGPILVDLQRQLNGKTRTNPGNRDP